MWYFIRLFSRPFKRIYLTTNTHRCPVDLIFGIPLNTLRHHNKVPQLEQSTVFISFFFFLHLIDSVICGNAYCLLYNIHIRRNNNTKYANKNTSLNIVSRSYIYILFCTFVAYISHDYTKLKNTPIGQWRYYYMNYTTYNIVFVGYKICTM